MTATRATQAGLVVLAAWLLVAPPAGAATAAATRLLIGLLCAAPLLMLLLASRRNVRQWGAWVAIILIPYFALSVGALLMAPGMRLQSSAFATLIAVVFFAGIAASRQRP